MNDRVWTAADFDYELPDELIAQVPAARRDDSRLLVVERTNSTIGRSPAGASSAMDSIPLAEPADEGQWPTASFRDAGFRDIAALIPPGDLIVLNNTRVLHARLPAVRPSGGPAEVLLIHPSTDDTWIAIGTPGRAMQPGKLLALGDGVSVETIEVLDSGMRRVRFVGATAADAMVRFGKLPLPPYIDRAPTSDDDARYQTVYAEREGSVAAPTAGLHFTEALLASLRAKGIQIATLDLEVGPGTFRPMDDGAVSSHSMHVERFDIPDALVSEIAACRARGGAIWAVGTTVVRALESAARDDGSITAGTSETKLMIVPGYRFRIVDHLITNFHLPRSTLLMLVAAFAGYEIMMDAYRHAVDRRYRFYSYGDAMVIV